MALKDEKAVEIMNRLEADFSKLVMHRHDEIAVIIRMRRFDRHVRNFLPETGALYSANPLFFTSLIVGAGISYWLSTRMIRGGLSIETLTVPFLSWVACFMIPVTNLSSQWTHT